MTMALERLRFFCYALMLYAPCGLAGQSIIHYKTTVETAGRNILFTITIDNAGDVALQKLAPFLIFENQLFALPELSQLSSGNVYYQKITVKSQHTFATQSNAILNVEYLLDNRPEFYSALIAVNKKSAPENNTLPYHAEYHSVKSGIELLLNNSSNAPVNVEIFAAVPSVFAPRPITNTLHLTQHQALTVPLNFNTTGTPIDGTFYIELLYVDRKKTYARYLNVDIAQATHPSLTSQLLAHTWVFQFIALAAFAVFISSLIGAIIAKFKARSLTVTSINGKNNG